MSDTRKDFSQSSIDKINYIETKINIYWWLYRGLLSQQPLTLSYYHVWFENYNNFYEMVYKIEDNEVDEDLSILAKKFEDIKYSLESEKTKLIKALPKETYESIEDIFEKIFESVDSIVEIIHKECE